jgi:ATP-dependent Clp protease ATP-binding subunit ClpB
MSVERRSKVEASLNRKRRKANRLSALWLAGEHLLYIAQRSFLTSLSFLERQRMEANKETKKSLEEAKYALEVAQRDGHFDRASQLRYSTIPDLERKLPHHDSDGSSPFGAEEFAPGLTIHDRVTSGDIARVVAKSTGTWQENLLTCLFLNSNLQAFRSRIY